MKFLTEEFVERQRIEEKPKEPSWTKYWIYTVCKVIILIILERLRLWYEAQLTDEQNGFRRDRGTTDGIFTAKRVQQITDTENRTTFCLIC